MVVIVLVGMGGVVVLMPVMRVIVVVIVIVIVMIVLGMCVRIAEAPQGQLRLVLHGHRRPFTSAQRARQEALQIRADPVEQLGIAQTPHVGRAQRIVVRRGAGRQQHIGLADAVLHRRGNQLQGLDAGQNAHFGLGAGGTGEQRRQQREGEKTIHGHHSKGLNWYIITSLPQHVAAHVQDPAGLHAP